MGIGHWALGQGSKVLASGRSPVAFSRKSGSLVSSWVFASLFGEHLGKADQVSGLTRFVVLKEKIEMSVFELNDDDVISMSIPSFNTGTTCKVSELKQKVKEFANQENKGSAYPNAKVKWFSEGVQCELLKPQNGWQKGKIRFRLEFVPDEPPQKLPTSVTQSSPLDDLRSELDV